MASAWDGIYSAYMTGSDGQAFAMFVFRDGILAGADPMGVLFDGTYTVDESEVAHASITVKVPPSGAVIQGAQAGVSGLTYGVNVHLEPAHMAGGFFALATPLGPVNIRLEKLRDWDGSNE